MSWLENIKRTFKSVFGKIKVSLRSQRWKETLVFFFFLLLSLGFWLLQSLQQEYEIEISIPVRYKNVPPEIAFTDTVPENITVHVKDKGSVLLNYSLGRIFAPIEADMKEVKTQTGRFVVSRKTIESDILKQLIASSSLIGFEPQQIDLRYSTKAHKKIPVKYNGEIRTKSGFQQSGDIVISPSLIEAYASEELLDTLTFVETVYSDINDGDKTIVQSVSLQKVKGVVFNPKSVTVTVPIDEYTDKTLDIPVICTDLPAQYTLRMFPASVKVTCSVPLSSFKQLSAGQFAIHISFADLEQNMSGTLPVKLTLQPEGVRNITLAPEKIEFILEQNKHD